MRSDDWFMRVSARTTAQTLKITASQLMSSDAQSIEAAVNEQEIYETMHVARTARTHHGAGVIVSELASILSESESLRKRHRENFDNFVEQMKSQRTQCFEFGDLCKRMTQCMRNSCKQNVMDPELTAAVLGTLTRCISISHPWQEVIDAANRLGVSMLFTGHRLFRH